MDAVITYVNGLDPVWQAEYEKAVGPLPLQKRFRDWGTLKYPLRGISDCLPFIDKVFLIVSSDSQVPSWADRKNLRVVLHKDIIPAELLPTFNSCTIEMFLHRIPGLSEEFLYFNDDMFPLSPCDREDFFRDGKGLIGISRHIYAGNIFKKNCKVSSNLALKALGKRKRPYFIRPQHICSPMLVSSGKEAFSALENEILASCSRTRSKDNPNQYLFLDYMYFSGKLVPRRISKMHISQGVWPGEKIAGYIKNPKTKFACINDVEMPEGKYVQMRKVILDAFEERFPDKSRFEL